MEKKLRKSADRKICGVCGGLRNPRFGLQRSHGAGNEGRRHACRPAGGVDHTGLGVDGFSRFLPLTPCRRVLENLI